MEDGFVGGFVDFSFVFFSQLPGLVGGGTVNHNHLRGNAFKRL